MTVVTVDFTLRKYVERPGDAELDDSLGMDVAVAAEVIHIFLPRPALVDVLALYENAGPLPLQIEENVYIGAVAISFSLLVVEHSDIWIVARHMPFGVVETIGSQLHLQYVLYDEELNVPSEVHAEYRQRNSLLVGTELAEQFVVKMNHVPE